MTAPTEEIRKRNRRKMTFAMLFRPGIYLGALLGERYLSVYKTSDGYLFRHILDDGTDRARHAGDFERLEFDGLAE